MTWQYKWDKISNQVHCQQRWPELFITVMPQECHDISNHWQLHCLMNRLLRITTKENIETLHNNFFVRIGYNWWWHLRRAQNAAHNPKFEKMKLFRHPRWWYLRRLKDPPTWLKVTTTLEDPNPHPLITIGLNHIISFILPVSIYIWVQLFETRLRSKLIAFTQCCSCHSLMMTSSNGNIFHVTGLLCWEFTGHQWIPRTKASDAELWCFLWSVPE